MNIHKNARLTPKSRERLVKLVKSGLSLKAASRVVGVSPRTAGKLVYFTILTTIPCLFWKHIYVMD